MTKAIAHTYTVTHEYRRQITAVLLYMCAALAVFYSFNLYRVISATVSMKAVSVSSASVAADLQKLDSQYLGISSSITPDTLREYGFEKGEVSAFISRTTSLGRVAVAGHEL